MIDNRTYWLLSDPKDVAEKLCEYRQAWSIWNTNPFMQAWIRNSIIYYSAVLDPGSYDTSLIYEGEQGELVRMVMPHARSLIRELMTIITKQKLAFQAIARTQGSDVMKDVRLGNALASQITEEQNLDGKIEEVVEAGLVLGHAFTRAVWRTDIGSPYTANEDGLVMDGDLDIEVHTPDDVMFDYSLKFEKCMWAECRTKKNRWDLIAMFPEMEAEILRVESAKDFRWNKYSEDKGGMQHDTIYVYEMYAKPCAALPKGRMLMFSDPKTIYFDGENRYGKIPLSIFKPEGFFGSGIGYPLFSNLLPSQEMFDTCMSAIATNNSTLGVQSVTIARGSGVSVEQIDGMNFISYTPQSVPGGGKPEALQLTQSAPETFKFAEVLAKHMMTYSMVSPTTRGELPPGVTSGAAIATLTTNALEFMASASKAATRCIEETMMNSVSAYRRFAKTERIVRITGKKNMIVDQTFTGSELDPIQAVKLNVANPLMQTIAGRSELAERLLQSGLIKNLQSYVLILEGAPMQDLYETELSEEDLIKAENELLSEGQEVPVIGTDDHAAHVRCHSTLLNDMAVRRNPEQLQSILAHIEQHNLISKTVDPMLYAMIRTGKMPEIMGPMLPGEEPAPEGGEEKKEGPPNKGGPSDVHKMVKPEPAEPAEPAEDLLERGPAA